MPKIEVAEAAAIVRFMGDYRFLSNFYPTPEPIRFDGQKWKTVEHAYQAAKCVHSQDSEEIRLADDAKEAKRLGRMATMRDDWEAVKERKMYEILRGKFKQPGLKASLLLTGDAILVEGNIWHDNEWGVCVCARGCEGAGENLLGRLLMTVRAEFA